MSYRDSYIEVDLDAISHNIERFIRHTSKAFFAVIKANGYGVGDFEVAEVAIKAGASYLAVSSLDEAMSLREKGIKAPILVLGYVSVEHCVLAKSKDITLTVTSLAWAKRISSSCHGLKMHMKINTGMNRLGMNSIEEAKEAMNLLKEAELEGIYTHYACSDDEKNLLNQKQYLLFDTIVKGLDYKFRYIHSANTDAACKFDDDITNAVRVGIGMIGYSSYEMGLKPCVALKTNVVNCHQITKDESVSYGAVYHATKHEWIITLPIGYADGWIRKNEGRLVYVNGEYAPIVGRICMDQMMVKVTKPYDLDTPVELFGEHISIAQVAKDLSTIPYEVLTLLSDRLTKKYFSNKQLVQVKAHRFER